MKSKKIVVLTQPLWHNYGCLLQAYALQRCLKALNYEVVTDEFPRKILTPSQRMIKKAKHFVAHYFLGRKSVNPFPFIPNERQWKEICSNTSKFVEKHIKTIDFFGGQTMPSKQMIDSFDTFVIGSDQVWRDSYGRVESYFCDFLANHKDKKVFSYAASFGVSHWQFDESRTKRLAFLAKQFQAISLRESSGVELCESNLGVKAEHVLDPTLLLSKGEYVSLIEGVEQSEGNMMCYILDKSKEKDDFVAQVEDRRGLKAFSVMKDERGVYPSVEKWLRGFYDAKFVVTDSFHGMVFSIIFEKPFFVILNKERGASRFLSLLNALGLENRLVKDFDTFDWSLVHSGIDYEALRRPLRALVGKSQDFLIRNLEKI